MTFIAFSMMLSLVSAYGVGMMYWKGQPLQITAGETKDISLNLQNLDEPEDLNFLLEITEGSDIASLEKGEYRLNKGTEMDILLTVSVPADAEVGSKYVVTFTVKPVPVSNPEGVAIGSKLRQSFDVLVVEPEPEQGAVAFKDLTTVIIVIAILLVLWFVFQFLKKRKML